MKQSQRRGLVLAGKSPEITRVRKAVKVFSKEQGNILILGEIGTGRRSLAEKVHALGKSKDKPFNVIECGAIGDTLDVDSVFPNPNNGHDPKEVMLFSAGKGTVFLNGVDRLNPDLQDKLYNFLATIPQDSTFNSRIIAVAEPSLEKKVRDHKFRVDLFHKLDEFRINLPAIRERKQDIPFIFTFFLETFCEEFGKPIPTVPFDVFEAILEYDWPGNIGELRNCVRNLVIMSPDGELVPDYLPFRVQPNPLEALASRDLPSAVSEVERFLIRKALARFEGNQSKAARLLRVSEAALRYKMKKYGLPSFK